MDELENKRKQLADPRLKLVELADTPLDNLSAAQLEQLKSDQVFEQLLSNAMNIPVADNLSEKIILNHRLRKPLSRFSGWAIAASLLTVSILSIAMLNRKPLTLSQEALAHVYNEMDQLFNQTVIPLEEVQNRLTKLGLSVAHLPTKITFANPCGFAGETIMHLVAEVEGKPVTIFILPQLADKSRNFADERFIGKISQLQNKGFVVIAEDATLINRVTQLIAGV